MSLGLRETFLLKLENQESTKEKIDLTMYLLLWQNKNRKAYEAGQDKRRWENNVFPSMTKDLHSCSLKNPLKLIRKSSVGEER